MSERNSSKDDIVKNDAQKADISFKKPSVKRSENKPSDDIQDATMTFDKKALEDLDKLFQKSSTEISTGNDVENPANKAFQDVPDIYFGTPKKVRKTEPTAESKDIEEAKANRKSEAAKVDTAKELLDEVEKTTLVKRPAKPEKNVDTDIQETVVVKRPDVQNKIDKENYIDEPKNPEKKKKRNKKSKSAFNNSIFGGLFLSFAIIGIALILAIGGISLGREYLGVDKDQKEVTFNIPKGSTSSDIAELLEENSIIKHKTFFELVFKLKAPETIYPGDITLQPSMGYTAIINQLATMRESYETATISFPEGITLLEAAKLLEENGVCKVDDFLFEFNKDQGFDFEKLINGNDNAFYQMEGYFFPDTYEFYKNDKGYNITKKVREHFEQKFTDKMLEKMKQENLTLNQLMTLASMVQWESNSVEDMPKVASVFLNRLKDPDTFPSFQSDATEKYIVKVIKEKATTKAEQEHYSESYDTYDHKGLPAGPICNPGIEAINAVLNPEKTNYYYFCNNLETGESFFAETLEEHEANLEKAGLK